MNIDFLARVILMIGLAACLVGMFVAQSGAMLLGFAVAAVILLLLHVKGS